MRYRLTILGIALVALAALAIPAASSAATARVAHSSCYNGYVFLAFHGMNEGPATLNQGDFREETGFDGAQNILSGAILDQRVPYTTVGFNAFDAIDAAGGTGAITDAVKTGVAQLQTYLTKNYLCSAKLGRVTLMGYSMGAWIINDWLVHHQSEWPLVHTIVYFGDPCWAHNGDFGLAQLFSELRGTCGPAQYYPSVTANNPFWIFSECLNNDPVCGVGLGLNLTRRENQAILCLVNLCSHLDYINGAPSSGPLYDGAKFMVDSFGLAQARMQYRASFGIRIAMPSHSD